MAATRAPEKPESLRLAAALDGEKALGVGVEDVLSFGVVPLFVLADKGKGFVVRRRDEAKKLKSDRFRCLRGIRHDPFSMVGLDTPMVARAGGVVTASPATDRVR